jgi:hypothetical protein
MKTNASMRNHLRQLRERANGVVLSAELHALAMSPLMDVEGALVLRALWQQPAKPSDPQDLTGYEALVNKIHVRDYAGGGSGDDLLLQGIAYAEVLVSRLKDEGRPCRVFLGLDPDSSDVTVRFFVRRDQQPWNDEDLDKYELEEVMQWDAC